jgi:hypothetical protein
MLNAGTAAAERLERPSESEDAAAPASMELDDLGRQLSWALPELPSAASLLLTWGRSDMGQTAHNVEQNVASPEPVEALKDRDVVHAAGSAYNSAFVTRAQPPELSSSSSSQTCHACQLWRQAAVMQCPASPAMHAPMLACMRVAQATGSSGRPAAMTRGSWA